MGIVGGVKAFWIGDCECRAGEACCGRTQIRRLAGREPYNMEAERRDTYTTGIVPYNSEAKLPRPGSGASNMPFYQTNPPFFYGLFYGNGYEYEFYNGNLRRKSVGSFSETNPPGGGFKVSSVRIGANSRKKKGRWGVATVTSLPRSSGERNSGGCEQMSDDDFRLRGAVIPLTSILSPNGRGAGDPNTEEHGRDARFTTEEGTLSTYDSAKRTRIAGAYLQA